VTSGNGSGRLSKGYMTILIGKRSGVVSDKNGLLGSDQGG